MTCLSLAGLASFCSSLIGCIAVLGTLWMQHSAIHLFPYALLLLEVPFFALASRPSRRFIIGLWAVAFVYPFAAILINRDLFTTKFALMFFVGVGTIASLLAAALLQYSAGLIAVIRDPEIHGAKYAPKG